MTSNGSSVVKMPEIKFTKLFINGSFVDSISGRTFETRDPRTGEVIANIAEGDKQDIDLAVKAAREAFDHGKWPRKSGFERGRILMKLADLIDQHKEELAILESLDSGKLFHLNKAMDIPGAANSIRYYAGAADKIHGETLKCSGEFHGYSLKEPIGVVGLIIPWNFPTIMFFCKVSPALAAGCTVIVKPAEQTPLTALYYANLAKEAGIPDGVLNVITGFGSTAGAALCSHMNVDAVIPPFFLYSYDGGVPQTHRVKLEGGHDCTESIVGRTRWLIDQAFSTIWPSKCCDDFAPMDWRNTLLFSG